MVLGGPKQRAVLGILLVRHPQVVSAETMVDEIWPDSEPERAMDTLQVYVAKLRKLLGSAAIETVRPGYRVVAGRGSLDRIDFESLLDEGVALAAADSHAAAIERFDTALGLWRGRFMADLGGFEFVEEEARRLDRIRELAQTHRLGAQLALGRFDLVLPEAGRLLEARPFDELLCAIEMRALYLTGNQAEALSVYQRVRSRLVEELGIEPGAELQELELRILNQDPTLTTTAPAVETQTVHVEPVGMAGILWLGDRTVPLDRAVVTLGRAADRAVVVDDPLVSRRHAEIRRVHDGFVLVDSGSANGTKVNGRLVGEHRLESGDVIRAGDTEMRFEAG